MKRSGEIIAAVYQLGFAFANAHCANLNYTISIRAVPFFSACALKCRVFLVNGGKLGQENTELLLRAANEAFTFARDFPQEFCLLSPFLPCAFE